MRKGTRCLTTDDLIYQLLWMDCVVTLCESVLVLCSTTDTSVHDNCPACSTFAVHMDSIKNESYQCDCQVRRCLRSMACPGGEGLRSLCCDAQPLSTNTAVPQDRSDTARCALKSSSEGVCSAAALLSLDLCRGCMSHNTLWDQVIGMPVRHVTIHGKSSKPAYHTRIRILEKVFTTFQKKFFEERP